jgi:glutaredoxin 3
MSHIEIYTRPGCGYCTHAKRLLNSKGLPFVEYDVYQQPAEVQKMRVRTKGRTYPQVFIDQQSVGGFTELFTLEKNGLLPSSTKR